MASDADDRIARLLERQDDRLAEIQAVVERQERAFQRQERAFEFQVQTFQNTIALLERMIQRLDDMGDQIRANTQAVLRVLDRLDGPEASPGT